MSDGDRDSERLKAPSQFEQPPVESFWVATWRNKGDLLNWDLLGASVLTVVGLLVIENKTLTSSLKEVLIAEFGLIGALLGLVIAGLAIVIGFLGRDYAVVLMTSKQGPSGEFWPFWFVSVLAAMSILAAGAGLFVTAQWPCQQRLVFGITTFLSTYAVLASVNLVAFVKAQGETRAYLLAREWEREQRLGKSPSR